MTTDAQPGSRAALIEECDRHLDERVAVVYRGQPLAQDWARIAKIQEECGEAIAAFIGVTGQNPRKGVTHDMDAVLTELADVAWTAMFAIQHFTKDAYMTEAIIGRKLQAIYDRMKAWEAAS